MAYMSAREMLSRFPMKMAEGGPVTYGKGATAADLLAAEEAYLANPSAWPPETAYAAILESGISMDDARAAGVADDTIDAIFTTPTALAGDQLSSQGQASFMDSGSAFADSITQAGVDAYKTKIMEDSEVSPEERREMQQIATEQGVTYQDMIGLGFDPNWLYDTPAPAAPTPAAPTPAAPTPAAPTPAAPPPADADYIDPFPQTQVPYTAPTVYQPLPDNTGVYAAGEESLDTTFRESAPRTEVLDSYGNLTNFDYTPAAKLRSATGSGYNWTPPTVTGRPRSLMGADLLARYTGGRAAADLRQLTTGLGNGRTYSDYTGVLQNPGSYGGGLSKSQLYSRMRGLDYQRDAAAAADRVASTPRGGIAAYLAANPDIGASYESQKDRLGGQSLQQFARNHYNTTGKAEMVAGTRGLFTLVADTPVSINPMSTQEDAFNGGFGEGEGYETSNWNQRYDMGEAGGVYRPFAHGGSVKKPEGFADGGTASADLKALDPTDSLFITEDIVEEVNPDNVQRDIPRMEWDGVDRPTPMETETETESKNMLETLASGYPKAVNTVANYVVRGEPGVDMSLIPMGELASDTKALGGMLYEALKEDPVAFFAENLPVVAQIVAGRDMNEFTGLANEARVSGDSGLADMYEQIVVLSAAGIIPGGAAANKAAKTTAIKAARDAAKATASDSASMLDEVDKPIVVYRGTTANESTVRPFTHTSTNPSTASGFAGYVDAAEELGIPQIPEEGGNVMKMLADVKNIATLEDIKRIAPETKTRQEAYPLLQKAGFDSYQDNYELVVFDPSDLKSAYDPLVGTDAAKMLDEVDRAITASRESAEDTFGPGTSQVTYLDEASGGTITMLERPDGKPASVLELLVPEAERRKGVGARLQAHALQMHPNMMGQVSSRYAAKSAYDLGRRPFDAPDATLEDVYKLIEENSSVNLVSQAQGTGSLPVSGPDAPATNTNVLSGIQAEDVFSLTDRNAAGMTSDMVDYQTAGILSRHPNYFKESKDIDYEIRNMSPDEYLKKASKILSKSSKRTPQEIIEYKKTDEGADYISLMAQSMRNGQVYAAPFLDYGSGGYGRSQEGMHRALAAKQLGMEEIPVMVLDSFKNPASPYRSALNELDTPPKPIKKANGGRIERVYNDLRYI